MATTATVFVCFASGIRWLAHSGSRPSSRWLPGYRLASRLMAAAKATTRRYGVQEEQLTLDCNLDGAVLDSTLAIGQGLVGFRFCPEASAARTQNFEQFHSFSNFPD